MLGHYVGERAQRPAMLIAIAGGHGKIALLLARLLSDGGDEVRGVIRNPDHRGDVRAAGAEPVVCDLESAGESELAAAIGAADAVVFAAGAGPGSGAERKRTMDHEGAVKLIAAARANGIDRYVMISAMGAAAPPGGDDVFSAYLRAKARADDELQRSGLRHTIVRPSLLTDDPPTGRVRAGSGLPRGSIPRADVAAVLAAVLADAGTAGLTFELLSGEQAIDEALAGLAG